MENTSKKDWAKNAIIVFLIIMLLLTLFSNTITNYTLPQVSVYNVSNGSITEAIRGTGTVEADDPYTLKATESRLIESVAIKKGDHVEKGDVIITLSPIDSDELSKAEGELADLKVTYYKNLLTADMTPEAALSVKTHGAENFNTYFKRIEELDAQIEEAKKKVDDKQTMVDDLSMASKREITSQIGALDPFTLEKDIATQAKTDAESAFTDAKTEAQNAIDREILIIDNEINAITQGANSAELSRARTGLITINDGLSSSGLGTQYPASWSDGTSSKDISTLTYYPLWDCYNDLYSLAGNKIEYIPLFEDVYSALSKYGELYPNSEETIEALKNEKNELSQAKSEIGLMQFKNSESYKEVTDRYNMACQNYTRADNQIKITNSNYSDASAYATIDKSRADAELKKLQDERTALINDINKSLDADKTNEDIKRKEEQVEKLRKNAMEGEIVAPVTGTVQSIDKVAGEKTEADKELCVIIPDGKDMTIKISVSKDLAKKAKIGDVGELSNAWAYPDAVCVLKSITDDTENPGKNSILTFTIKGNDIQIGESMSLSLNSVTKQYDTVIPKSALKTDNSGNYVYVLIEKSSPLGNRYIANKVMVTVLAQDDNNVAVSGGLNAYMDSVITNSNKMVEAGKQVRLSESSVN